MQGKSVNLLTIGIDNANSSTQVKNHPHWDEKCDQVTGVIAPFFFATVLTFAAVSKLDKPFCHHQMFISMSATAASLTELTCAFVFLLKCYQLINQLFKKEKNIRKKLELLFSVLGMGVATTGTFCFAVGMDKQINVLKGLLCPLHLPADWFSPLLFLFAILFLTIATVIAPEKLTSKVGKEKNTKKCLPCDLNCKGGIAFLIQMPGIYMLYRQASTHIDTELFKNVSVALLLLGAAGALYLCLDGFFKLNPPTCCSKTARNLTREHNRMDSAVTTPNAEI